MSSGSKSSAKEQKPGSYLKVVSRHNNESDEEHGDDKFSHAGTSQSTDGPGDEQYGEGEAFDDEDAKAEGSGGRERRKIEIKFIQNKARRHITFSKRKHGIMKKAWELSVLTGTQVLLLVVSETGLVYTFTTPKLQPLVTQSEGKNLIQACLNAPESPLDGNEESPMASQGDSEGDLSPSSSSAPVDVEQIRSQNSANDHLLALRKAQASQDAQGRIPSHIQGAQNPSPPVASNSQDGNPHMSPQNEGQAAALRAAMHAQAQAQAQALAASGLPPHIQQFAAQGYKVPPSQYGYQGYPFSAAGGQMGSQLAGMGQMNGSQFAGAGQPLDTATLLAMQQGEGNNSQNGQEYPGMLPQQSTPQAPSRHQS